MQIPRPPRAALAAVTALAAATALTGCGGGSGDSGGEDDKSVTIWSSIDQPVQDGLNQVLTGEGQGGGHHGQVAEG